MSFGFQEAYDELNPADDDYRFYAALAASVGVSRAVDLGCGTGTLARMLAFGGAGVTGIDPDPEMLRVARLKDQEGRVIWRSGYSGILESESAEFAVMSGHVAQVFTEEDGWLAALRDLHRALVPGGLLAFESRNPGARKWEAWTRELTLRTVETLEGPVEFWHETATVDLPLVGYDTLTRNLSTGEATTSRDVLAFRDEQALRASIEHAGFEVDHVYGDWDRTPPAITSPELILIVRKPLRHGCLSVSPVITGAESERERSKRHYQRALFDGIAERYGASRPGYPGHLVESVIATAGLGPRSAILEIGCGTGQLTERLARLGLRLTAIDIGASMIAAARRHVTDADVSFQVTSFEDLDAVGASFDLVISSAAFHWIDPEVAFIKSAWLLRPGGWLALLGTEGHPLLPDGQAGGHPARKGRHRTREHEGDLPELAAGHPAPFRRRAPPNPGAAA